MCFLVPCVPDVPPYILLSYDDFLIWHCDHDTIVVKLGNAANAAVVDTRLLVVLQEHDLRSYLEAQSRVGRIGPLGEVALDIGLELEEWSF